MPQTQADPARKSRVESSNGGATKPAHVVRFGRLKGAIWRNVIDNGNASRVMYNVTFVRSYRDEKQWKDSTSFGFDDLLALGKIADFCHTWIHEQRVRENQEEAAAEAEAA